MVDALRLFAEDETDFTTLGIGVLSDAIAASVTEERNSKFELTFTYPVDGAHYADIALGSIVCCKPSPHAGKAQPFRVYSITTPMNGRVTVDAAHISYDLNSVVVTPFTAESATGAMEGIGAHTIGTTAFMFKTDKATEASFALKVPQSVRSTLGGTDGSVLDTYTGEYEWDGYTVTLHNRRGSDRGVSVEYGKNLTDLKQEANNQNVYTQVYPFWHSDELGTVTLDSPVSTGISGRERTLALDLSNEESLRVEGSDGQQIAPTQAQLESACEAYIKANELTKPKVSITVDFVELSRSENYMGVAPLERVWLCDTVTVRFPRLGVDATAEVVSGTYDVLADRWSKLELGDARSSLSATIAGMPSEIAKAGSAANGYTSAAVEAATRALTGISGGHVVIWNSVTHKPDNPNEILIMDTDSVDTAVNVWRYNDAGWGHSSTGYLGPFTTSATLDGTVDAATVNIKNLLSIGDSGTSKVTVSGDGMTIVDSSGNQIAKYGSVIVIGKNSAIGDIFAVLDKSSFTVKSLVINNMNQTGYSEIDSVSIRKGDTSAGESSSDSVIAFGAGGAKIQFIPVDAQRYDGGLVISSIDSVDIIAGTYDDGPADVSVSPSGISISIADGQSDAEKSVRIMCSGGLYVNNKKIA